MNDDNIGSKNHDPNRWTEHNPVRPEEGFIEERLAKLEHYQEMIRPLIQEIKDALATASNIDVNGMPVHTCRACDETLPLSYSSSFDRDNLIFPICDECLKVVGNISKARRKGVWIK